MDRFYRLILLLIFLLPLIAVNNVNAQTSRYEVLPAPDVWYNDVDGILLGVRLKGQVPGTFEDGPHRLEAGFWVGTWLPSLPVSYFITYTEPIEQWSDYGSEANIQLRSSVRTGYHNHGIAFNKRWQQGFDERRFREFGIYNSFEKRFDHEYVPFEPLWSEFNSIKQIFSDRSKLLTSLSFELQDDNKLGWYNIEAGTRFQYLNDFFTTFTLRATQRIEFNDYFGLRLRGYAGIASENSAPEYLFSRSTRPAIDWMSNGFTRAKGTIPTRWMNSGNIHVAGGANVRGYNSRDIASFQYCVTDESSICVTAPNTFNSVASLNAELDYWNPIAVLFNDIPYASEFLNFRTYLFFDSGTALGVADNDPDGVFSNAGAGFSLSLNIPDYLGKPRGFVLRYEIPFWLSDPGDEDAFKFRHLFGFGAVVSF